MADGTGLSAGATAGIVGAGVALAAGVAALIWSGGPAPGPAPEAPESAVIAEPLPEPEAEPEPEPEAVPEAVAEAEAPVPLPAPAEPETTLQPPPAEGAAPAFDLVRIEPGGATVVAGTAAPGATVAVLLDAGTVAETSANARGEFVAMLDLPPSAAPRLLTLLSVAPDGTRATSREPVVLAPAAAPLAEGGEEVASASPEPAPPDPAGTAEPAPVAIRLGEEGAEVLTPPAPAAAPAPVAIAALSYTDTGAVRIAGTGTPGATVRLYLDNAVLTEMAVGAYGGWGGTLPEMAPGALHPARRRDRGRGQGPVAIRDAVPARDAGTAGRGPGHPAGAGGAAKSGRSDPGCSPGGGRGGPRGRSDGG